MKILLWFVSKDTAYLKKSLDILERQYNGVEIVGMATGEEIVQANRVGGGYDILLVVGAKQIGMSGVTKIARQLELPDEKLLGDYIVCIPGFTLEKYRKLQRSRLSVFSRQCFGGCISNLLGLPFRSPFVNLWLNEKEFLRFLHAPKVYLEEEPHFEKLNEPSKEAPDGYPVFSLGNILLNMSHYRDKDEALAKWLERKTRINWYNLIAITFTEREENLREFDAMPFGKKVCFVPFKSNLDSAWYINPEIDKGAKNLEDIVNRFGFGHFVYYDPFDMLLYGKKTPLIEM